MPRLTWFDEPDDEMLGDESDFSHDDDLLDGQLASPSRFTKPRKRTKAKGSGRASVMAVGDVDGGLGAETAEEFDDEITEVLDRKAREKRRAEISEPFKCRNCRAFIGEPPSGGRQRNHCPMCLYSLHVDHKTPGDRASDCRSAMQPIGVFYRPNLEQMVVHECRGCGFVRYNRIAADDNPILLSELPVVDPSQLIQNEQAN